MRLLARPRFAIIVHAATRKRTKFADLFTQLRDLAFQTGLHEQWLTQNAHKFTGAGIRKKVSQFKRNTSTGLDELVIADLRAAPEAVLHRLGAVLF